MNTVEAIDELLLRNGRANSYHQLFHTLRQNLVINI